MLREAQAGDEDPLSSDEGAEDDEDDDIDTWVLEAIDASVPSGSQELNEAHFHLISVIWEPLFIDSAGVINKKLRAFMDAAPIGAGSGGYAFMCMAAL